MGGDLVGLLRQDIRLPEASIHDFGRDLVIALQARARRAAAWERGGFAGEGRVLLSAGVRV